VTKAPLQLQLWPVALYKSYVPLHPNFPSLVGGLCSSLNYATVMRRRLGGTDLLLNYYKSLELIYLSDRVNKILSLPCL